MNIYLLSFLVIWNFSTTKTPNFYPNYIAAREASKNSKKDLLIFFSKSSCTPCDEAWTNFENDPVAPKIYISTIIDAYDFDGAVFLDKYNLKNAPSWLILNADGQVKDKWEGEWKKTPTRESMGTKTTPTADAPVAPAAKTEAPVKTEADASKTITPPASETVKTELSPTIQTQLKTAATQPSAPVVASTPANGFVLQAGYFGSEVNASNLINDLQKKGFEDFHVKSTSQNGSTYYRVISRTYQTTTEANESVQSLQTAGIKATVKTSAEVR